MGLLEKASFAGAGVTMLFNVATSDAQQLASLSPAPQKHGKYQVVPGPAHEQCTIGVDSRTGHVKTANIRDFNKDPEIGELKYMMADEPIATKGGYQSPTVEITPNDDEIETDYRFQVPKGKVTHCNIIDDRNKIIHQYSVNLQQNI